MKKIIGVSKKKILNALKTCKKISKETRIKICVYFNCNFIETLSKSLKKILRNLQKKLEKMSIKDWGTVVKISENYKKVLVLSNIYWSFENK